MAEVKKNIIWTFNEIKNELDNYYIFKEKMRINDFILKKIYEFLGKYIKASKVDYNSIALTFNKVYFWKNLLKSLIFFDAFYDMIGNSVIDVGCGAAPVSIAIAKLMENRRKKDLSFTLIDKSKNQLSIAKDITQILSINVEAYIEDFFDISYEKYSGLVIFSYFFCEQESDFLKRLFDNRDKFSEGFVFIDYEDNIAKIEKYFCENGDNRVHKVSLKYSVSPMLSELIYDTEVNVHGCFYRP